jgi:hypothetical protein
MKPVKLDSSCPQYQTYLQDLQDSAVAADTENVEYGGAGDEPDLNFFSEMEQILVPQALVACDEQQRGGSSMRRRLGEDAPYVIFGALILSINLAML